MVSPAREAATRVLHRVADDGAWAAPALAAALADVGDVRDAALATEIVYGALRTLPHVDAGYGQYLRHPAAKLDAWLRAALRGTTYQLLHLSRVPPHAAVDDAVTLVKAERGKKLAGVANAVLRKVAKDRPAAPERPTRLVPPGWVASVLRDSLGEPRATAFLDTRELPPPIGLRLPSGTERGSFAQRIREARPRARVELGDLSPLALLVREGGEPTSLPGFEEGAFSVQEQGAQVVGLRAGVREGERVLDACAGRGNKTTLFAAQVGASGSVTALDVSEPKLERITPELERLGLDAGRVETRAVDLTVGTGGLGPVFDRVVVDAPCTGLGTVHRRPEILLRLGPDDPARMGELQRAILERAAGLVRPGGVLIYAVCSFAEAEGPAVFEPLAERLGLAEADRFDVGPWSGDCDAYQVFEGTRARVL